MPSLDTVLSTHAEWDKLFMSAESIPPANIRWNPGVQQFERERQAARANTSDILRPPQGLSSEPEGQTSVVSDPSNYQAMIPPLPFVAIEAMVRRLQADVPTGTVVVYGSYARGDARAKSDLNLIVIKDDVAEPYVEAGRLRRHDSPIPIDLQTYSRADWDGRSARRNVLAKVASEGIAFPGATP